jgi:starch synthase (maltosyl-transferring)
MENKPVWPGDGKNKMRVQIESVQPKLNGGRFPIKRIIGDTVSVEADIFVDGHNELSAVLLCRPEGQAEWSEAPMAHSVNDRWSGEFKVNQIGFWNYTIEAWIDHFKSWQRDLKKRVEAEQDVAVELLIGAALIEQAAQKAAPKDQARFAKILEKILHKKNKAEAQQVALAPELTALMARYPERRGAVRYKELGMVVDPPLARFSAWYELFPRSCSPVPGQHGTFKDVIARLPYVAEMGFNVLYLPPIHPIGVQFRKGKNNSVKAERNSPGSPWAIGSVEGGHYSIHPALGTLHDFHTLVSHARKLGLAVALDLAYQCSADHPYVKDHPEWFRRRPDNTIQYAENPPKKYQDIYPLDFETENWQALWDELRNIVSFWIQQGVHIFRVDNPHTKDLSFWEWMIADIKREHPEVVFLAEAFTRPKLMYRLAKLGFSLSYNYFAWRNTKWELEHYFTEINKTEIKEFFRPSLWPNTPDILTEYLQLGGHNAFKVRLLLAATLGASYGIYGPAFELGVNQPLAAKSEEYLDSEKYEIKHWDLENPGSLKPLITRVNQIRQAHPVLQQDHLLEFYHVDNEFILAYGKHSADYSEIILVIVNLDPRWAQSGWIELPLQKFGISATQPFQVHDLLAGTRYLWNSSRNFIKLDPAVTCAHIFKVEKTIRHEESFDYYL